MERKRKEVGKKTLTLVRQRGIQIAMIRYPQAQKEIATLNGDLKKMIRAYMWNLY